MTSKVTSVTSKGHQRSNSPKIAKFQPISLKTLSMSYASKCKGERSEALTAGRSPAPPAGASWRSQLVPTIMIRVCVRNTCARHHAGWVRAGAGRRKEKLEDWLSGSVWGGWRRGAPPGAAVARAQTRFRPCIADCG